MDKSLRSEFRIAIVGAGFSGTALAVQLLTRLNQGHSTLRVTLINRHPELGRGVAYGTHSPSHTLNVPAGRMSLFPDRDSDFLEFAQSIDPGIHGGDFVPRSLYGKYLERRLGDAGRGGGFRSLTGEVTDVQLESGYVTLSLSNGSQIEAERLVLATGNYPPVDPPVPDGGVFSSPLYIRDPWSAGAFDRARPERPVLLIGTGLTMVDVALELKRRGMSERIYSVSRRGLLPQAHRVHADAPAIPDAVGSQLRQERASIRQYLRTVRKCAAELSETGLDWRDVVGALRPITPALWQALDSKERSRFLRHVQPYWDVHRHRMAPSAAAALQELVGSSQLTTSAGRLVRFERDDRDQVRVTWRPRGAAAAAELRVGTVINCTGPSSSLKRIQDPLIRSLLERGWLTPDPHSLGVLTDDSGALLNEDGKASRLMFYTGPLLRAGNWECTAVPELRAAAARLADVLAEAAQYTERGLV